MESEREGGQEYTDRLKSVLRLGVSNVVDEEVQKSSLKISRQCVHAITELLYDSAELMAKDCETFAKHAKRSVVNDKDVKLVARKNKVLLEKLNEFHTKIRPHRIDELAVNTENGDSSKTKRKPGKTKEGVATKKSKKARNQPSKPVADETESSSNEN